MTAQNFATSKIIVKNVATVDAMGTVFIVHHPGREVAGDVLEICIGVGFCVARSTMMGNAKACELWDGRQVQIPTYSMLISK